MNTKLDAIQTQLRKFKMSQDAADAAIESEVAILVTDAAALKTAFAQLEAEVATGGPPSAKTLADLKNAVDGVTGTIPPETPPTP